MLAYSTRHLRCNGFRAILVCLVGMPHKSLSAEKALEVRTIEFNAVSTSSDANGGLYQVGQSCCSQWLLVVISGIRSLAT